MGTSVNRRPPEGRRAAAADSTRSAAVLLAGDDPAAYQALEAELTACFRPATVHARRAVREMAAAEWRLARVRDYIARTVNAAIAPLAAEHPDADAIELQRLAWLTLLESDAGFRQFLRFETRFERQYERALRDLKTAPPEVPNEPEPAPPLAARSVACPCGSGKKYKRCCGTEAPPVLFPREPRGAPLSLYGNDGGGNEGG